MGYNYFTVKIIIVNNLYISNHLKENPLLPRVKAMFGLPASVSYHIQGSEI